MTIISLGDAYGGLLTGDSVASWTYTYTGASNVTLRSQDEILSQLRTLLADSSSDRWTDAQVYGALNLALSQWEGRVLVPFAHEIDGGWVGGTYEYLLANFIEGPITPQQKYNPDDWYYPTGASAAQLNWTDVLEFSIEPTAYGGRALRFDFPPYPNAGRVLWWGHNGPVPTTAPVLSATIVGDDDTLTLTSKPRIGRSGYIKIGAEWLIYFGYTEDETTLTLNNLARGVDNTSAASHLAGASVSWGVAMDDSSLLRQLLDQTRAHLMEMWLSNPSSRETAHYEKQMVFYQQRADAFWRRYVSSRPTRFKLTRMGVGPTQSARNWYTRR